MADTPFTPVPLAELGFPGPLTEAKSASRHYYLSLMHWFEAEKFRLSRPDLVEEVLRCHSLHMLDKMSKRNKAFWRDDWVAVRGHAMVCGMMYAYWADPHPERWRDRALVQELASLGFPEKFCQIAFEEFQPLIRQTEVGFLGTDTAPHDVLGRKLNLIHKKFKRRWAACFWVGRRTNWRLYNWLREQHIPMRLVGQPKDRLTLAAVDTLANGRLTCVFEDKAARKMEATIRHLRENKAQIDLELFAITRSGATLSVFGPED